MGQASSKQDLTAAALLAALAGFAWFWVRGGSPGAIAGSGGVTYATMPSIYAAALLVLAGCLAVQALIRIRREDDRAKAARVDTGSTEKATYALRFVGTLAALLLYASLLDQIPFAPLTMAFLFSMFWLYGHRRWLATAVVAAIGGIAFDVLFIRFLHLPL